MLVCARGRGAAGRDVEAEADGIPGQGEEALLVRSLLDKHGLPGVVVKGSSRAIAGRVKVATETEGASGCQIGRAHV